MAHDFFGLVSQNISQRKHLVLMHRKILLENLVFEEVRDNLNLVLDFFVEFDAVCWFVGFGARFLGKKRRCQILQLDYHLTVKSCQLYVDEFPGLAPVR